MNPKTRFSRKLLAQYLSLGVNVPMTSLAAALQVEGNSIEAGSLVTLLNQLIQAQMAGTQQRFSTSAAASLTLTSLQNLWQRFTNGGAVTVTIDAAYNIVNQIPNPFNGQTFPFEISTNAATTIATPTLLSTDVTLSGTTTLTAAGARWFQGQITQLSTTVGAPMTAGTTFTSIAQVGTSNLFTVTLATNALVPVVGQVFFLNVTAGTLPSGWYPIVTVSSATSFVIATPLGQVWTATAGTVPGTILVPPSQYSPNLPGVYAPLLTITGMAGTVLNIMVV